MNKWNNKNKIQKQSCLSQAAKAHKMKTDDYLAYIQAKRLLEGDKNGNNENIRSINS